MSPHSIVMHGIATFLSNITMYRLMLVFLCVLHGAAAVMSIIGVLPYGALDIVVQVAVLSLLCWGINICIARVLGIDSNVESSLITGLILAAIVGPLTLPAQWYVAIVVSVAAIASKYLLVRNKSHIFNPAAFGVIVSAFLIGHPASWWMSGIAMAPFILVGGLLIMQKLRYFHVGVSFAAIYLGALMLDMLLMRGGSVQAAMSLAVNVFIASPILFFVFVMLVEPMTAPLTRSRRTAFGAFIGGVLFLFNRALPHVPFSVEAALLIGNIFGHVISSRSRFSLTLRKKERFTPDIEGFWFEPSRSFTFSPGQFLEYTLPHKRPDIRGVRRYFTIASSPTEEHVLLAARFFEKSSSFKKALRAMEEGESITAWGAGGEFTLPADSSKKLAFIAGGVGITPFRSMIRHLHDIGERRDIVLLYGARTEEECVFRDLFEAARESVGVKSIYVLSEKGADPSGIFARTGFIDEQCIREEVSDFQERIFYISGPEAMVRAVEKALRAMEVPRRHVKKDYFPGYG